MVMNNNQLDEMKKYYAKEFNRRIGDDKYVAINEGETRVRILPSTDPSQQFFVKSGFHKIAGEYINCPRMFKNKKCPICEKVSQLYNSQRPDDIELARQIKATKRFYYNVIVRGQEDKGVRVLTSGVKLFEKILGSIINEEIGDITDIKNGYDFIVKKCMKSGYWNYDNSEASRKQSLLHEDPKKAEEWMNNQWPLEEEVTLLSYNELKDLLEEFLTGTGGTAQLEEKVIEKNSAPIPKPVETKTEAPKQEAPSATPKVEESTTEQKANDSDLEKFEDELNSIRNELS